MWSGWVGVEFPEKSVTQHLKLNGPLYDIMRINYVYYPSNRYVVGCLLRGWFQQLDVDVCVVYLIAEPLLQRWRPRHVCWPWYLNLQLKHPITSPGVKTSVHVEYVTKWYILVSLFSVETAALITTCTDSAGLKCRSDVCFHVIIRKICLPPIQFKCHN